MDYSYIFTRQHSKVIKYLDFFIRAALAYSGGKAYIEEALIKHVSEVDPEFDERKTRAYYFNYPQKIARLITQYVLAKHPDRTNADSELIEDFSGTGLRTNEVMRQASTHLNCYGMAWLLVDNVSFSGDLDMETKKTGRIRPYCRALPPLSVPDWSYGADGLLEWAIVEEMSEIKSDPFDKPTTVTRRRLWTRTEWKLFERADKSDVILKAEGTHNLGIVPLIQIEEVDGFGMGANHWFEDVVRVSDAILNAESEAQMNIIKQMYGLLVVSESFRNSDFTSTNDDGEEKFSHVLARSAALWETQEEKGVSRYISPSGAETATIRAQIKEMKKELFEVVGLAIQSESREAQTAESKAWDHQNVSQFLAGRAEMLEQAESKAWEIMHLWDKTVSIPDVSYNREFAVMDLQNSVTALLSLSTIQAGDEYQREIARVALNIMDRIKPIDPEKKSVIEKEINNITDIVPTPEQKI